MSAEPPIYQSGIRFARLYGQVELHRISRKHLAPIASLAILSTTLVILSIATMLMTRGEANTNLSHVIDNPEKYLGERFAVFSVVNVTLREDPLRRLIETYYLVRIKDSYGHTASFVISSDQYSTYAACIGKRARFRLFGERVPGIVTPPDRLITNILTSKSADPYAREFYTIHIALADK